MVKSLSFLIISSLALASCGSAVDECARASNPTECRAWADAGGDINDYLVGGMVGYMLANRGGQTVIVRDTRYVGAPRQLSRPLLAENAQLRRKVERQKVELRRQQEANRIKSAQLRAAKSSSSTSSVRSSSSSFRSSPSFRSSSSSFRSSSSSFRSR